MSEVGLVISWVIAYCHCTVGTHLRGSETELGSESGGMGRKWRLETHAINSPTIVLCDLGKLHSLRVVCRLTLWVWFHLWEATTYYNNHKTLVSRSFQHKITADFQLFFSRTTAHLYFCFWSHEFVNSIVYYGKDFSTHMEHNLKATALS